MNDNLVNCEFHETYTQHQSRNFSGVRIPFLKKLKIIINEIKFLKKIDRYLPIHYSTEVSSSN